MIGFCSLASGSKGNALYLGTSHTKILIDAGISAKQLEERLKEIGVAIEEIQAVLVSHDHMDHIAGIKVLSSRYHIPILANSETLKGIYRTFHEVVECKIFSTNESFEFGDLLIHPFNVHHDTLDPVGFVISHPLFRIGICCDLGFVSSLVKKNLETCNYLYLEANHEPSMVHACNRSNLYKQRVLGRQGHLSNEACSNLLREIAHPHLKHVILGHLSSECNSPHHALRRAKDAIEKAFPKVKISIALQEKISDKILFEVARGN